MSSLSNLPTELLIELFAVCAVLDPQYPSTLAGLSRRLRTIILGAPTILQSIHLQDDPPSKATQSAL
ncbi:hypothetical protein FIBSPDRAFT_879798 [Athelia psychrophila]|uniref:F-box domain-containing protein n=1 Tax=Athelia psychrophila TaxID=1759441 RepID=A0A167TKU6_9AGAM|nr:hypothetical protein FIBSPDRAFT_879798 [Fibularhizoctonia sp. CBS 109695]